MSGMGGMGQDEAGSSDNRLTLDPSAFGGFAKDWEDGTSYGLSIKVQQTAPGEFIVTDAKEDESPVEDGTESGEEGMPAGANASAKGAGSYPNPAVDRMMRGMKR